MAEYDAEFDDDFDNDDDDTFDNGQSSSLVRKLRKELNATKRAMKERDSELSALRGETRTRTIKEVLAERGANPKIAAFIPSDLEVSPDAVGAWLTEYGDVFGFNPESEQPAASIDANALGRMNSAEMAGVPIEVASDLLDKINNASTREELQALIARS